MPTFIEPINVLAGVDLDLPPTTTPHYTASKAIRFVDGYPEKIKGWQSLTIDNNNTINGASRSNFSYKLNGFTRYQIGTNTRLYDLFGTTLTNITPVKTTSVAASNSLSTYYTTLGANPIATVDGSTTLTITDAAHKFQAGDTVVLSGASTTNGVPNTEINASHFVRSVTTNAYTIIVNTAATSTGSGGGASVVRSSGYITVTKASHGLSNGDRVKISGAADAGGILAAQINLEFLVRNATTNTFDIYTAGTATSSVSSAGGASTVYFEPIDAGSANTLQGQGYGVGLYGVGLYGVSKTSSSTSPPRIWSHDRYGDLIVSAVGNQGSVYSWDGDVSVAPTPITNAPPANYAFVSNNILVVLGYDEALAQANGNGISWSDQGVITNWSTGQAGSDTIEGAGTFISHVSARGENLLFTDNQVYTFRYIGGQFIWQTRLLDSNVGIIGQSARVNALGIAYWMSNSNFYMYRGGNVEVIPSNSSSESTILRYVFDDFNFGQKEKTFGWYNEKYREVWFHYPSAASNECDRVARFNIDTFAWTPDEISRSCAEYPSILTQTPYLVNDTGTVFLHESGNDDAASPLEWSLSTNWITKGTNTEQLSALIPDQNLIGDMTVLVETKDYPSSVIKTSKSYTVNPTTGRFTTEQNGRYWRITLSGSSLGQLFEGGQWWQEGKVSSRK